MACYLHTSGSKSRCSGSSVNTRHGLHTYYIVRVREWVSRPSLQSTTMAAAAAVAIPAPEGAFRSMNVNDESKTPYSDATQVGDNK